MTLIIFKKLELKDALKYIVEIELWFNKNPRRKRCQTGLFSIRRGFVGTDILKHTEHQLMCRIARLRL